MTELHSEIWMLVGIPVGKMFYFESANTSHHNKSKGSSLVDVTSKGLDFSSVRTHTRSVNERVRNL